MFNVVVLIVLCGPWTGRGEGQGSRMDGRHLVEYRAKKATGSGGKTESTLVHVDRKEGGRMISEIGDGISSLYKWDKVEGEGSFNERESQRLAKDEVRRKHQQEDHYDWSKTFGASDFQNSFTLGYTSYYSPKPYWTGNPQTRTSCDQDTSDDLSSIRAAVLLPNNTDYVMALARVLPVLRLAQQEVRRRDLLPADLSFQFLPRDDRCDAVYAQIRTFEAVKQNVHVFFGPACEYSVAPVARMIKFWSTPLLTTGALTFDFSRDKRAPDSEYHLLVRAGLLSFQDLALFLIALLDRYGWARVMLVYDKDGCRQISGKHTCKLMMETLVEFFKQRGLHYGSFDLEKHAGDGIKDNLRREMGLQYNSE